VRDKHNASNPRYQCFISHGVAPEDESIRLNVIPFALDFFLIPQNQSQSLVVQANVSISCYHRSISHGFKPDNESIPLTISFTCDLFQGILHTKLRVQDWSYILDRLQLGQKINNGL